MKKSMFKRLVDMLKRTPAGFTKIAPNKSGSKLRDACLHTSRRGADGTIRR